MDIDILGQIQGELISQDISLTTTLRKAKVLAAQLESDELSSWISHELDGYKQSDELPDYRVISTQCAGTLTDGITKLIHNHAVMWSDIRDQEIRNNLKKYRVYPGIRKIEQLATELAANPELHLSLPGDLIAVINGYRQKARRDGYYFTHIFYSIGAEDFLQILDTVKTRLLDYVLKLGKNWNLETNKPPQDELHKLFNIVIQEGGSMSVFDQRNQQVNYQYNAAGNINFQTVDNKERLATELDKLKEEIERAKEASAVKQDVAIQAQFHLIQAAIEAKKENPSENQFLEHINKAKGLLEGVTSAAGMITALLKAAEIANQIFR